MPYLVQFKQVACLDVTNGGLLNGGCFDWQPLSSEDLFHDEVLWNRLPTRVRVLLAHECRCILDSLNEAAIVGVQVLVALVANTCIDIRPAKSKLPVLSA